MKIARIALGAISTLVAYASAQSIVDIASSTEDFSTLTAAVVAAGLAETLSGPGTFTVFAPPNSAFDKLPQEVVSKLLTAPWKYHLQDVLLYHALPDEVRSTDLRNNQFVKTLNGEDIVINTNPPRVNEESEILISAGLVDVEADNGVIHGIDDVLLPTSVTSTIVDIAVDNSDFSTLVAAVTAADLAEALSGDGPFTVFAPTNDAFAALPPGTVESLLRPENKGDLIDILTYHVIAGDIVHSTGLPDNGRISVSMLNEDDVTIDTTGRVPKINDSNIIATDILGNNGIIHVIDQVLLPPSDGTSSSTGALKNGNTVTDVASSNKDFQTLTAALVAVGLDDDLAGNGPFTVFAPTDGAFNNLPDGLVSCLLKDKNLDILKDILLYHVASGKVLSSNLERNQRIETLEGRTVKVRLPNNGNVFINDSRVVTPDLEVANGVIHVINRVLVPPNIDVGAFLDTCQNKNSSNKNNNNKNNNNNNNNKKNNNKDRCHYRGDSADHGDWLTGPTHRCKCDDGHWTRCYRIARNGHLRN